MGYALRRRLLPFFLAAVCALLPGCQRSAENEAARVLVDGARWPGGSMDAESLDDLRVYVTLDGKDLIDLPFSQAHTIDILLSDGGENHIVLTGESVYMNDANCENHDCVDMGAVTRENLELRVMGGFIICLPHRISVEVRGE